MFSRAAAAYVFSSHYISLARHHHGDGTSHAANGTRAFYRYRRIRVRDGPSIRRKVIAMVVIDFIYRSHIRMLSSLDWPWITNSNNGLHASGHPHWLQLQLAAAKLLKLAVQLPADKLPQFQMYINAYAYYSILWIIEKLIRILPNSGTDGHS